VLAAGVAYALWWRAAPEREGAPGSETPATQHSTFVDVQSGPLSARFVVTDRVVAHDVERIGVVLGTFTRGTNLTTNNLMPGAGYEPAYDRYLRRIDSAGENWFQWDTLGGVSEWELNDNGWGNGANVRFYRVVDGAGRPLSYRGATDMSEIAGADHVIFLGEATVSLPSATLPRGGWDAANNRVWIDRRDLGLRFGDYAFITVKTTVLTEEMSHDRVAEWFKPNAGFGEVPEGWHTALAEHDYATLPEEFIREDPGETALEVTAGASEGAIKSFLFHSYDVNEGLWYSQLHPGARYRVDVWLKQQGIAGGEVRFDLGGPYATASQRSPWIVGQQWAKYSYEFKGPPYPTDYPAHLHMGLRFRGPGTLYVDNFLVYRADVGHEEAPFSPGRTAFDEFMSFAGESGPKPSIRFYGENAAYWTHSPMERLCSNFASSRVDFIYNISGSIMVPIPHALEFAYQTGDTPETRAMPWLVLSEEYTEAEWKKLIEYLGVPYDPEVDTPESRPMAHLRYTQRGHGRPWTDDFREILVEYGSETWHAGNGGFGWHGFGRPNHVWQGGVEYGLFARYMFDEQVGSMPEWEKYDLSSRIAFVLNGGYMVGPDEYGEVSIKQTKGGTVRAVSHANYVGPKWETDDTHMSRFDADGLQRTLVAGSHASVTEDYLRQHAEFRNRAARGGIVYDLVSYEGGPSGYFLPGDGTPAQVAVSELYGKSVAMATAALDVFLYSSLVGYSYQGFFRLGSGRSWSSHNMPEMGGSVPHPSWLAATMRNRYIVGDDMVEVVGESVPAYQDATGATVALVGAYAFRAENTYSVILTNRTLEGVHNGHDFGTGTVAVSLSLPFPRAKRVTLYRLAHEDGSPPHPAENNLNPVVLEQWLADVPGSELPDELVDAVKDSRRIVIHEQEIDPRVVSAEFAVNEDTGGVPGGLPQGAAYIYVFELP
jgi:hypothetical protein